MGHVDAAGAPAVGQAVRIVQQLIQVRPQVEGITVFRGLIPTELVQLGQELSRIEPQPSPPCLPGRGLQQGQQQMFHVHLPVLPGLGLGLTGQ